MATIRAERVARTHVNIMATLNAMMEAQVAFSTAHWAQIVLTVGTAVATIRVARVT